MPYLLQRTGATVPRFWVNGDSYARSAVWRGWDKNDQEKLFSALDAAFEAGYDVIDTVTREPFEQARIGEWLAQNRAVRVAFTLDRLPAKSRELVEQCKAALRGLNIEQFTFCTICVAADTLWQRGGAAFDEATDALGRLRQEGAVQWSGLADATPDQVARAAHLPHVAWVQTDVALDSMAPWRQTLTACAHAGINVVGRARIGWYFFFPITRYSPPPGSLSPDIWEDVQKDDCRWNFMDDVKAIALRHGTTSSVVAMAWLFTQESIAALVHPLSDSDTRFWWADALTLTLDKQERQTIARRYGEWIAKWESEPEG